MRAWIVFLVACSFPTKHAGSNSDAPMQTGDGSGQIDSMRMIDGAIDTPQPVMKRVFVSSASLPANFNGTGAADNQCNNFANAAGLGGIWIAWLSTPNTPAASRSTHPNVPYTLVDKQTIVAQSFTDLTDGQLAHPIDHTEFGQVAQANTSCQIPTCVWTGTTPNGAFMAPDCQDWTSSTPLFQGVIGDFTGVGPVWSAFGQTACANQAHIYCIEQ